MAFVYDADIWCDDCGYAIRAQLTREGDSPEDPDDESSYDSDDFPKRASDDDEADCPQHCAAGAKCRNSVTLSDGTKIGALIGGLTAHGVEYVRDSILEGGPVAEYWRREFGERGYDFRLDDMDDLERQLNLLSKSELRGIRDYVDQLLHGRGHA